MNNELNLIKIHKRRMNVLLEQQAKRGINESASVVMEIDDIKNHIAELETILRRRLNSLQLKAAAYGLSADPHISMEIEDIQDYFND
jgi:hypothetical protein